MRDPNNLNVRLGKVDATLQRDLASKYSVSGYPTILYFSNGAHVEYKNGRSDSELI